MRSSSFLIALLVALLGAASLAPTSQAQTNLLANGDFETCTSSQATATANGRGLVGWYPYAGRTDPGDGNTIGFVNGTVTGPGIGAYSGFCFYKLDAQTVILGITQQAPVTAGTQYVLSFFVMQPNIDNGVQFSATYQYNTATSPVSLMTQAQFPAGGPFWWTQFKFVMTPPSGATAVNITFSAEDYDFGLELDYVTLWAGDLSAAPGAPPALKANPSNNLLSNGDFESGAMAPWTSSVSMDPYEKYSQNRGYTFVATPAWGTTCPQGKGCVYLGTLTPYTLSTTISNLNVGTNYQLSFVWVNDGGFNKSNVNDTGASLAFYYSWGTAAATTRVWSDSANSTAAVGTVSSPQSVSVSLGTASSSTLNLAFTSYNYATQYYVDMIAVTSTGSSNAASASHSAVQAGSLLMAAAAVMAASTLL